MGAIHHEHRRCRSQTYSRRLLVNAGRQDERLPRIFGHYGGDIIERSFLLLRSQGFLLLRQSCDVTVVGAGPAGATLAYAESASIVSFLVEEFGWEKMRQLLAAFKDGATNDDALKQAYSFDVNGLELRWKKHIGA